MRILLDECVDWRLLRDLTDYDAKTVKQRVDVAVIVLRARTTRLIDLRELIEPLHRALKLVKERQLQIVSWRDIR